MFDHLAGHVYLLNFFSFGWLMLPLSIQGAAHLVEWAFSNWSNSVVVQGNLFRVSPDEYPIIKGHVIFKHPVSNGSGSVEQGKNLILYSVGHINYQFCYKFSKFLIPLAIRTLMGTCSRILFWNVPLVVNLKVWVEVTPITSFPNC